jgi:hypothetical protein
MTHTYFCIPKLSMKCQYQRKGVHMTALFHGAGSNNMGKDGPHFISPAPDTETAYYKLDSNAVAANG